MHQKTKTLAKTAVALLVFAAASALANYSCIPFEHVALKFISMLAIIALLVSGFATAFCKVKFRQRIGSTLPFGFIAVGIAYILGYFIETLLIMRI